MHPKYEHVLGAAPAGEIQVSSNRSFGVVLAIFLGLVAVAPMRHREPPRWWAAVLGLLFLLVALFCPGGLDQLNRWWTRLGILLGRIVNPIVMGALFYLVFTPIGVLLRWLGKDLLHLRQETASSSYWIERTPPGPSPDSMPHQF